MTGFGAAQRGGRWNSRFVAVVYASSTRALALLEMLAHVERDNAPADYEYYRLEIPDDTHASVDALPDGWDVSPPPAATRAIGDAWKAAGETLVLFVPSAIVPQEMNLLINPAHPRFAEITVTTDGPVNIDRRCCDGDARVRRSRRNLESRGGRPLDALPAPLLPRARCETSGLAGW